METETIVKSTQEQAVAAWINYLNQIRLDKLVETLKSIGQEQADKLSAQAHNLSDALSSIDEAIGNVDKIIETNRGGVRGIHGYIAEPAQVGIGNARSQILGGKAIYEWVDDNGQWDITRKIAESGLKTPIQMKFVQGNLSLDALLEHLEKYPDSLEVGGKYQIPKDFYEKIQMYMNTPADVANKMPTSTGEFSLKEWNKVQDFIKENKIPMDRIEPSDLTYKEAQAGTIHDTLSSEKDKIAAINDEQNKEINKESEKKSANAYTKSKPSLAEGAKATAISAAVEGATTFCAAVIKKRKSGKKLRDFSEDDWREIGGDTALGTLKGGVRGASIYALTNYTATPAAVASALTTAAFGVADQVNQFRNGTITETQLVENSEILCLDTAVSAFSSVIGQIAIPVPILGAVIGNAVGSMMYQIAKDSFTQKEQEILRSYLMDIEQLNNDLDVEYENYVAVLNDEFMRYLTLVHNAFSPDYEKAFDGSIELALSLGIDRNEVLTSKEEIEDYFLS